MAGARFRSTRCKGKSLPQSASTLCGSDGSFHRSCTALSLARRALHGPSSQYFLTLHKFRGSRICFPDVDSAFVVVVFPWLTWLFSPYAAFVCRY